MKVFLVTAAVLAAFAASGTRIHAYAIATHEEISLEAVERQTHLSRYLAALGIDSLDARIDADAELFGPHRSAREWVERGSRREDDFWPILRFRNHFFDPVRDRGLEFATPCGFTVRGHPSTDWGLGENGAVQAYSLPEARSRFHRALTASAPEERKHHLAAMFRTLGQVIHLIQDAGQPQHTRNDSHGPALLCAGGDGEFEDYVEKLPLLSFEGYGTVRFEDDANRARSFWTTPDGRGLADYSNRGFVSAKTNFERRHCEDGYGEPVPEEEYLYGGDRDLCAELGVPPILDADGNPLPCHMVFVRNTVVDRYDPARTAVNAFAAATSIVDVDSRVLGDGSAEACPTSRLYAVNEITFDAAQKLLIPRAVGYSAGMLDYFFRGELAVGDDLETPGNVLVENLGDEAMIGTFEIHFDDALGRRHLVARFGEEAPIWLDAKRDGSPANRISLPITEPLAPPPERPGEYLVVFKGQLGNEGSADGAGGFAVAAAVGRICHPRVMDLGSFGGPDWQPTFPPENGNFGIIGLIQPSEESVTWISDPCCIEGNIENNSIQNHRTTFWIGPERGGSYSGFYDPPFEHYLRFRVGETCGVRLEATVDVTNVPFEESGFWVGGRIFPLQATPSLVDGELRLDLPPAAYREGSRAFPVATWEGQRMEIASPFQSTNSRGTFAVHDRDVYPSFSGTYHLSTELAWSSQDPETGAALQWSGGTFVPGVPAVPYWTASHGYLGIFFEADDFGVADYESSAYNEVEMAKIRDFRVTVFPLAGIAPPILTEND
jgi:hypothetical protein